MADAARAVARRGWPILRGFAGFTPAAIPSDLIAGLTLAAIVIPEQMATARLAGMPPQAGFFAFIAASIAFALFGASRFMSVGADSTITPIFAGALAAMATSGSADYLTLAAVLALMVGGLVLGAGVARMGWIANLLSEPVTVGFLAGIAVHIAVSQGPSAFGLPTVEGALPQQIAGLVREFPRLDPYAVAITVGVLALIVVGELVSRRIPGALIGMAAATAAVIGFGLEAKGVPTLGTIQSGLPTLALPRTSLADVVG